MRILSSLILSRFRYPTICMQVAFDGAESDAAPPSEASTVPDLVQPYFADRGRSPAPRLPSPTRRPSGRPPGGGPFTASGLHSDRQSSPSPSRHEHRAMSLRRSCHSSRGGRRGSGSLGGEADAAAPLSDGHVRLTASVGASGGSSRFGRMPSENAAEPGELT